IGCVELSSAGRSYDSSSSVMLNLVSALELALYNGKRPATGDEQISPETGDPSSFKSFEEFRQAFIKQTKWLIGQAIELNEYFGRGYQEILPSPLLSAFFKGPMDSGNDLIFGGALYNASGATHIGFADTVDSLNAIEQAVFVEKICGFDELKKSLESDFNRHEKLHTYLINRTPKYGSGDPASEGNARALVEFLYKEYQGYTNYRGGKYRPAYWTMTNHAGQGKMAGALPSGRRAGKVFASGITPASQAADDLASCLKSVARLDSQYIPGGLALNLKYPSINGEEDLKRFSNAIEAYFRYGGLQVQFNIMSYDMLIDAKNNPDKYPDLLVRVSGYSAYFKDLNEEMKNEIITRTEYSIRNGTATEFLDQYKEMLPYD
ncbi:MAG: formate acetyltransferase, partial [bacterium]|nr:formate acetyltransferase [bacterium]